MFYVYEWFIIDTDEVIYVGKGCKNRYRVRKHNKLFNEMIRNFNCDSRIVKYFEKEEEAFLYERQRVSEMKEKGQCVCNIQDGGFGGTESSWTEEKRKYYSEHNVMKAKKQRERMSKENPMKNPEVAKRVGMTKAKKVVIGNKTYDSLVNASKEYGVCPNTISYWLERGYTTKGELCYYDGTKELHIKIKGHHSNKRSVIINGKKFEMVKDGAEYLGITPTKLIKVIKSKKPYKNKYYCEYDNQQPSHENTGKSIVEGSTTR